MILKMTVTFGLQFLICKFTFSTHNTVLGQWVYFCCSFCWFLFWGMPPRCH